MVEIEFFRPLNFLNKTTIQTITVLIRMITPPTSGTMITRIVLVRVLSTKSIGGDVLEFEGVCIVKSPSKGVESVVCGVDVVAGGMLLDLVLRVPGIISLNLAAVETKPILIMTSINYSYSFPTMQCVSHSNHFKEQASTLW